MNIKEALRFIFLNSGKIIDLADNHFVPAIQLLTIYRIYLDKKDNEIYHSRICQLCDTVKKEI